MQSPMKRRLLVRRGATDPLVDVCRNRRSIINRRRNEACAINRFRSEQSHEYSGGREARGRTRGNWWPDVAAAYFINSGELVSVSDKRRV